MIGIQESIVQNLYDKFVSKFQLSDDFEFAQLRVDGASGGILLVWDKSKFVSNRAFDGEGYLGAVGKWTWDRLLRSRASREFKDLSRLLLPISLNPRGIDKWAWDMDTSGIFIVKKLRKLLGTKLLDDHNGTRTTRWCPLVPKKERFHMVDVLGRDIG